MIDIKLIRENPELVKENIKKKFQDQKLPLVDEVKELDEKFRQTKAKADELRAQKNAASKKIGELMRNKLKDEADKVKAEVAQISKDIIALEEEEPKLEAKIKEIMMDIPNIIDPSVPIGKSDAENVEKQRFGEPAVPNYEIPHHADILNGVQGMDKESAGRTSG